MLTLGLLLWPVNTPNHLILQWEQHNWGSSTHKQPGVFYFSYSFLSPCFSQQLGEGDQNHLEGKQESLTWGMYGSLGPLRVCLSVLTCCKTVRICWFAWQCSPCFSISPSLDDLLGVFDTNDDIAWYVFIVAVYGEYKVCFQKKQVWDVLKNAFGLCFSNCEAIATTVLLLVWALVIRALPLNTV